MGKEEVENFITKVLRCGRSLHLPMHNLLCAALSVSRLQGHGTTHNDGRATKAVGSEPWQWAVVVKDDRRRVLERGREARRKKTFEAHAKRANDAARGAPGIAPRHVTGPQSPGQSVEQPRGSMCGCKGCILRAHTSFTARSAASLFLEDSAARSRVAQPGSLNAVTTLVEWLAPEAQARRSASLHRSLPSSIPSSTPTRVPCPPSGHSNTRARPCSAAPDVPDRVHRRAIAASARAHRRPPLPGGCATTAHDTTQRPLRNRAFTPSPTLLRRARPLLRVRAAANFPVAYQPRHLPAVDSSARRADRDICTRSTPLPSSHPIVVGLDPPFVVFATLTDRCDTLGGLLDSPSSRTGCTRSGRYRILQPLAAGFETPSGHLPDPFVEYLGFCTLPGRIARDRQ